MEKTSKELLKEFVNSHALTVASERVSPCFTRRFAIVITFDLVLFILVYLLFGFVGSYLTM